jgi:hypothetical protein
MIIASQPEYAKLLRVRNTEANKERLVGIREDGCIGSMVRASEASAIAVRAGLLRKMRTSETNGLPVTRASIAEHEG